MTVADGCWSDQPPDRPRGCRRLAGVSYPSEHRAAALPEQRETSRAVNFAIDREAHRLYGRLDVELSRNSPAVCLKR
jgi:hypothetical protein